mmetsp:Transcript_7124/g.17158  ORF Transcript_7124/g.17158 Transcript_7124/m.17158 type:complete len:239 (-) Transcript_7124:1046-1762(-)
MVGERLRLVVVAREEGPVTRQDRSVGLDEGHEGLVRRRGFLEVAHVRARDPLGTRSVEGVQLVADGRDVPDAVCRVGHDRPQLLERLKRGEDAVNVVLVLADDALELGHAPAAQPQVEYRLHTIRLDADAFHIQVLGLLVELPCLFEAVALLGGTRLVDLAVGFVHQGLGVVAVGADGRSAVLVRLAVVALEGVDEAEVRCGAREGRRVVQLLILLLDRLERLLGLLGVLLLEEIDGL